MPSRIADGRFMRFARVRWLIALTCLVVLVDITAGVLTIVSSNKTAHARATVTAGQAYIIDTNHTMKATLSPETGVRGYLLTGDRSNLTLSTSIKAGPKLIAGLSTDSIDDP